MRNLTQSTTEEMLKEKFEGFGKVERVKKIKDYAFIHFEERDDAVKVSRSLDLFLFLNLVPYVRPWILYKKLIWEVPKWKSL